MAYQLTPLGISVLALLTARPMHSCEMVQILVERHADLVVRVRAGSPFRGAFAGIYTLGADAAANALGDASVRPAGYLAAFDYLLATTQAGLSWLHGCARRQHTNEVEI